MLKELAVVQVPGLIVNVVAALPKVVPVAFAPRLRVPVESIAKLPPVLVQLDVPPDAKVMAPVELPIPTVFPAVAAKAVLPVTDSPPDPWICPVPELTPTAVRAPEFRTLKLVELIKSVNVPVRLIPLATVPLILIPFVTVPALCARFKRLVTVPEPVC